MYVVNQLFEELEKIVYFCPFCPDIPSNDELGNVRLDRRIKNTTKFVT